MVVTRRISWRHVGRQGTKQSRVDSIRGFFDNQAPSRKPTGLLIYWLTSSRSRNKSALPYGNQAQVQITEASFCQAG